jgi:hypothetical protein
MAFVARGKPQVMALGFVVLATAHIVGVYFLPREVPAMHLFSIAGFSVGAEGDIYEPDPRFISSGAMRTAMHMRPITRTANAIGTLVSGLVGCALGALAFKHGSRE